MRAALPALLLAAWAAPEAAGPAGPLGIDLPYPPGCLVVDRISAGDGAQAGRKWIVRGRPARTLFMAGCEVTPEVVLRAPEGSRAALAIEQVEKTTRAVFTPDLAGTYVVEARLNNRVAATYEVFDVPDLAPFAEAVLHEDCRHFFALSGNDLLCGEWWWSVDPPTLHIVRAFPHVRTNEATVLGEGVVMALGSDAPRVEAYLRAAPEVLASTLALDVRTFARGLGEYVWVVSAEAGGAHALARVELRDGALVVADRVPLRTLSGARAIVEEAGELLVVAQDGWERLRVEPLVSVAAGQLHPGVGGLGWDRRSTVRITDRAIERVEVESGRVVPLWALAPLDVIAVARPFVLLRAGFSGDVLVLELRGEELVPRATLGDVESAARVDGRRMAVKSRGTALRVFEVPE